MEKLRHYKKSKKVTAMTLVEVMVALAIVSFVFSALTAMAFEALARAKKLELQDQMRSHAIEASEYIYNLKDSNWRNGSNGFADKFNSNGTTLILEETIDPVDNSIIKELIAPDAGCYLHPRDLTLRSTCDNSLAPIDQGEQLFGRIIQRTGSDDDNEIDIKITVACIEDKCESETFKPFILTLKVYRTSGISN